MIEQTINKIGINVLTAYKIHSNRLFTINKIGINALTFYNIHTNRLSKITFTT